MNKEEAGELQLTLGVLGGAEVGCPQQASLDLAEKNGGQPSGVVVTADSVTTSAGFELWP